ncbi:cytochrome b/b6 domain-containing protein [Candidatus Parabeggiatoa sp. HSG14]|uniref:cytochrome b/b6 domain-containing protein n=1 Tax=Candidatus Parabeggiatoa sp. HSG14 TaxID=3055593 RepID=UPI0025A6BECD|nr:cytochrome b/b6 domain-containing protein [Thiotrichales bacterium HSG14]
MNSIDTSSGSLTEYSVWDRTTRWFHWINALAIIGLIGVGLVILYAKALGVSTDGKILLKTIHVYIGYVFCLNLAWRIIWGFIGNKYARWKAILPGKGFFTTLHEYKTGFRTGNIQYYQGHNPAAKLMIMLLFVLLMTQAITGLVLAGTDIYFPPFGQTIKGWVAEDVSKIEVLKPYSKENVNKEKFAEMRAFRKPFIITHVYTFYILLIFIGLHITAIVVTEIRERSSLISAMFTGRKVFPKKPVDAED